MGGSRKLDCCGLSTVRNQRQCKDFIFAILFMLNAGGTEQGYYYHGERSYDEEGILVMF